MNESSSNEVNIIDMIDFIEDLAIYRHLTQERILAVFKFKPGAHKLTRRSTIEALTSFILCSLLRVTNSCIKNNK